MFQEPLCMPNAKIYIRYRPGTILQCMTSYLGVIQHVIASSCFYSEGQIKLKPKYCTLGGVGAQDYQ
jgi:hypothetical protein